MSKILILAANPKTTSRLRLDEELRDIDDGLRRAQHRDRFTLAQRLAVRPRDIQRAMLSEMPQIVHFSGHGEGDEGLVFEDDTGQAQLVSGEALAQLFALFADPKEFPNPIHCVVLNGCYSHVQAKAIAEHVPYVIGMRRAIGDRAAVEFAVGFYDALGAGRSVEFAFKLGCAAISLAGKSESATPILISQTSAGEPPKSQPDVPQPSAMAIPQGRAELYQFLLNLPAPQFEAVLFDLNPPKGNISPPTASQGQRVPELLSWLNSPIGPGLEVLRTALEKLVNEKSASVAAPDTPIHAGGAANSPLKSRDAGSEPDRKRQFPVRLRNVLPLVALSSGLAMALLVSVVRLFGAFERLELMAYDHVLTARWPVEQSDRIIVVEADRAVVDAERATEPKNLTRDISDGTLADVLNQLRGYGVSVIGIDWYLPADGQKWTEATLQPFQSLDNAEPDGPAIYGVCAQAYEEPSGPQAAEPAPNVQAIPKGRVGFSNFAIDRDEVLRRHLVGNGLGDTAATSTCQAEVAFSALVALRYLEQHQPEMAPLNYPELITPEPENHLQIGGVLIERINAYMYGGYQNLDPGALELLLNYREPPGNDLRAAFPHVSMQAVQAGTVEPAEFEGKIVLLGLTAKGLAGDIFSTPYGQQYGVTLHAHMVDHLLSLALGERRQIRVWSQGGEFAWILLWAIIGGLLAYYGRDRTRWLAGSFLGGLLAIYIACRLAMGAWSLWLPLVPPLLAFAGSHGVVVYTGTRFRATKSENIGPGH